MPKDKTATHAKVLEAAREEFMEYGFERASMRRIGQRANMTAAGLYRHCKDKKDLFRELVAPSIEKIDDWEEEHVKRSVNALKSNQADLWKESEINMMRDLIYPHMEEYRLLLTKAQGTEFENFLHDMTNKHQEQMLNLMPLLREKGYIPYEIDAKALHLLLSAYLTAMFEPVIHEYDLDEAYRCLKTVEDFFLPGWNKLLGT